MFGFMKMLRSTATDSSPPALTIIGDDTTIRGATITGAGDLRVEGTVDAHIVQDGRVVVAAQGVVRGSVRANTIHVAGTVRGELHAEETLELSASSDVEARIDADATTIESGPAFRGGLREGDERSNSALAVESSSGDRRPTPVASMGTELRTPDDRPDARWDDAAGVDDGR